MIFETNIVKNHPSMPHSRQVSMMDILKGWLTGLNEIITPSQRDTILNLKYFSSFDNDIQIHGVEIYEAIIEDGIEDFGELKEWVKKRRMKDPYFRTP